MTDYLNTAQLSLGGQRGQSAGGVAVVGPSSGPIDFQVGSLAMKCVSSDPRAGTITAGSLQTTTAGAGYVPGSYSDVPLAGGTITATANIVVATNGQLHSAIVTNGGYGHTKDDVLKKIVERWEYIHHPLHSFTYCINPRCGPGSVFFMFFTILMVKDIIKTRILTTRSKPPPCPCAR